jgi:prevent-host-death family protein
MTSSRKRSPRARSKVVAKASKLLRSSKSSLGAKSNTVPALTQQKATKRAKSNAATGGLKRAASALPTSKRESWLLQDAKARFSELVRRVKAEGPQRVTVRGREEVVVVSADEFRRLRGERTGAALIAAMQASPSREIEIAPSRSAMPVRTFEL